jgi:hypothetical protein
MTSGKRSTTTKGLHTLTAVTVKVIGFELAY